MAHENTKGNMQKLDRYKKPENAKWLPKQTFKDKMSLFSGADPIDLLLRRAEEISALLPNVRERVAGALR